MGRLIDKEAQLMLQSSVLKSALKKEDLENSINALREEIKKMVSNIPDPLLPPTMENHPFGTEIQRRLLTINGPLNKLTDEYYVADIAVQYPVTSYTKSTAMILPPAMAKREWKFLGSDGFIVRESALPEIKKEMMFVAFTSPVQRFEQNIIGFLISVQSVRSLSMHEIITNAVQSKMLNMPSKVRPTTNGPTHIAQTDPTIEVETTLTIAHSIDAIPARTVRVYIDGKLSCDCLQFEKRKDCPHLYHQVVADYFRRFP